MQLQHSSMWWLWIFPPTRTGKLRGMLYVVTLRNGDTFAEGHIVADGFDKTFCAEQLPQWILIGWPDLRSPYIGKQSVTCTACRSEWLAGRRGGWRGLEPVPDDSEIHSPMVATEETPESSGNRGNGSTRRILPKNWSRRKK